MQKRGSQSRAGPRPAPVAASLSGSGHVPHRPTAVAQGSGSQPDASAAAQNSAVRPVHAMLGVPLNAPAGQAPTNSGPSKRQRKERMPNWTEREVLALIEAKRQQNLRETSSKDGRDLMTPDSGKWQRISAEVMEAAVSTHFRDGQACKSKWNQLIPEYKRIVDFLSRTGTNDKCYWTMDSAAKKAEGLPKSFQEDVFDRIHEWQCQRPAVQPPHSRDLMASDDRNLDLPNCEPNDVPEGEFSADVDEENYDSQFFMDESDYGSMSKRSPGPPAVPSPREVCAVFPNVNPSQSARAVLKSAIPIGVTPVTLSSSDTCDDNGRRRNPNTGVRRKNISGHSLIADATRASGDAMAGQLKDIAEENRKLEGSKIEVQLKLFAEQMQYQRDRDRCLQDTAKQANDNAKLSIEKQAEVVHCLSQLASVLSAGLHTRETPTFKSSAPLHDSAKSGPSDRSQTIISKDVGILDAIVPEEDMDVQ